MVEQFGLIFKLMKTVKHEACALGEDPGPAHLIFLGLLLFVLLNVTIFDTKGKQQ